VLTFVEYLQHTVDATEALMNDEHILVLLRDLTAEKPTTKMGQVRWAFHEIEAALAAGHTLQMVHARLKDVGIEIGYRTLSLYLGRLKRRQGARQPDVVAAPKPWEKAVAPVRRNQDSEEPPNMQDAPRDPFSNIRTERQKKQLAGFDYNAFSMNKHLLE
jgi:hypothetical protein